jgi:hypothetical protein
MMSSRLKVARTTNALFRRVGELADAEPGFGDLVRFDCQLTRISDVLVGCSRHSA